ncbi:hypothetical protein CASFOL_021529 [Castilleja foliolosa]|uniref:Uncharacterized protein n=1 Tax=Castilleja foliolosa TaxID=1961234 RepID=A0ABD3CWU4_9LAMI
MERVSVINVSLFVVMCSIFILNSLNAVYANDEGDALIAFNDKLSDPNKARNEMIFNGKKADSQDVYFK